MASGAQPAAAAAAASQLPPEVLVAILSRVPTQERLAGCALVCTAWAAAAATTSAAIQAAPSSQAAADALARFLQRQGQRVTQLQVHAAPDLMLADASIHTSRGRLRLEVPLRKLINLQRLALQCVCVQPPQQFEWLNADAAAAAGAAGGELAADSRGVSPLLPALTQLSISEAIAGLATLMAGQLSCLRSLRELELTSDVLQLQASAHSPAGQLLVASPAEEEAANAALQVLLPHATALQRLRCASCWLAPGALQFLRGASLACVQLQVPARRQRQNIAEWLAPLQAQHLTRLEVRLQACGNASLSLRGDSIGRMASFTRLQHLVLDCARDLDAAVLVPLTQLTHLTLDGASSPPHPELLVGPTALLAAIAGLRQLRHLSLEADLLPRCTAAQAELAVQAAAAYAALTSSSHLTRLCLCRCELLGGAGVAMFAGRRRGALLALQSLRVTQPQLGDAALMAAGRSNNVNTSMLRGPADFEGEGSGQQAGRSALACGIGVADLVAACPNLQQLWLPAQPAAGRPVEAAGAELRQLVNLTALTELQLDGAAVTDALSAELLAKLTQLSRLDLHNCPLLTDTGLAHLTALRRLTSLQVRAGNSSLSSAVGGLGGHRIVFLTSGTRRPAAEASSCAQDGAAQQLPVWQRLRQLCMRSTAALQQMLVQREAELADAEARAAAAEARAAAAEARAAAVS